MKSSGTREQAFDRGVAAAGVLFAAMLVMNKLHEETTVWMIMGLGFPFVALFFVSSVVGIAKLWAVVGNFARGQGQGEKQTTVQTALAMVQMLGGLVLFFAAVWGWGVFGLGRLVGAPSVRETVLIPLVLIGASGAWLLQRSGVLLLCGVGLWWLAQDSHYLLSPAGLIVTILTASVLLSWRRLQNTPFC